MEKMGIPAVLGSEMRNHLNRRPTEEGKPFEIIGIVQALVLIQPWTVEEIIVPNRPDPHPTIPLTGWENIFFNQRIDSPLRCRYSQPTNGTERSARFIQATIVRKQENDVMAKLRQLKRQ